MGIEFTALAAVATHPAVVGSASSNTTSAVNDGVPSMRFGPFDREAPTARSKATTGWPYRSGHPLFNEYEPDSIGYDSFR